MSSLSVQEEERDAIIRSKWRKIWFRFRCKATVFRISPIIWIGSNVIADYFHAPKFVSEVILVAYGVVMVPTAFLLANFGCPACGKPFFFPGGERNIGALPAMFFSNVCKNCGAKFGEVKEIERANATHQKLET